MKKFILLLSISFIAINFSSCKKEELGQETQTRLCFSCFGTGKCIKCGGNKICHVCMGEDLDILPCTFCKNTGKCQDCRVTGKCLACGGKGYVVN